jgi:hypothetical protein
MAYPNKLIIEGLRDTYMADPDNAAIGIWLRCDLAAEATTPDGTPALVLATDSTRGDVVTMQPIAAGAYGLCQLSNGGGGSLMGVCVGPILSGADVYAAASGKVAGSGSVLLGTATCAGYDGGTVTYIPLPVAA